MGGNLILNIILAASLNQLWSMLNGLQLSTHMQLFNLKFPANASFLLNFLVTVATFDVMPIETIWFFFDFPEQGSYSLSFQSSGYEYIYLIENMGTCFFLVQIYITQCVLVLLLWLLIKYAGCHKLLTPQTKLRKGLFWSVPLRFIFEAYLELVICVTIGLMNLTWASDNFSIQYCTVFTVCFALVVLFMPTFTLLFYYNKIDSVEEHEFKTKYGTLYDGLQLDLEEDKRKSALFYPFLFIVRRLIFMITVIFMAHFTWSQIATQFAFCFIMVIYLGFVWPFVCHSITKIEIFNEIMAILLCYLMLCFTDWIPRAKTRYLAGWIFIAVICVHLGTHLTILVSNSYKNIRHKAK